MLFSRLISQLSSLLLEASKGVSPDVGVHINADRREGSVLSNKLILCR